jgi:hypothetical protein
MQALAIVDLLDEGADRVAGLLEVAIAAAVDFLLLSVFMKLSALALS